MDLAASTRRIGIVIVAVAGLSACSSDAAASNAAANKQQTATTVVNTTTTSPASTTTTLATKSAPSDDEFIADFRGDSQIVSPSVKYRTQTEVPFTFVVPEGVFHWRGIIGTNWSATIISESDNFTSDPGTEPGMTVSVAEVGTTRESVADAIVESQPRLGYERSAGLFGGRDVIVLDGLNSDPELTGIGIFSTGEESFFQVLLDPDRQFRSHIFEESGRVFIVSVDSSPDDHALVLAEFAPFFESLEIGG